MSKDKEVKHGFGAFVLTETSKYITVETRAKDWSCTMRLGTRDFGMLSYLLSNKDKELVEMYLQSMMVSRLIFSDARLVKYVIGMVDEFKKLNENQPNENDSDEILSEEAVLQLKTVEAAEKHIKKYGKK